MDSLADSRTNKLANVLVDGDVVGSIGESTSEYECQLCVYSLVDFYTHWQLTMATRILLLRLRSPGMQVAA